MPSHQFRASMEEAPLRSEIRSNFKHVGIYPTVIRERYNITNEVGGKAANNSQCTPQLGCPRDFWGHCCYFVEQNFRFLRLLSRSDGSGSRLGGREQQVNDQLAELYNIPYVTYVGMSDFKFLTRLRGHPSHSSWSSTITTGI